MIELFGPEYERPPQVDCPDCRCCTQALCLKGRTSVLGCHGHTTSEARETVFGCPCSAETTRHTAAWRAAQVRVTRLARELPLPAQTEALLRALADGMVAADSREFAQLRTRGLADSVALRPVITELGRTYLRGRDGAWTPVSVRVLDVDDDARLLRVDCAAWRPDEPVTVLLGLVLSETGLTARELPGRWLTADANCQAANADELVLSAFRDAPQPALTSDPGPLALGWSPHPGRTGVPSDE